MKRPPPPPDGPPASIPPALDVLERPGEVVLRADMPGVEPSGITVRFEDGLLTFSGRIRVRRPSGGVDLLRERADFHGTFAVDGEVDPRGISAEYEDGVLTLRLPRPGPGN